MVFQDPTGALNPRQTIYESVAEGLRIHHVPGDERELVERALSRAGMRPPGTLLPALPARALRRTASARGDRRRAGARPAHDRRRRAGLEPRRDPCGDPPPAARAARQLGTHDPHHPRPRSRLDDRRPGRRDVPGHASSRSAPPRRSCFAPSTPTPAPFWTSFPRPAGSSAPTSPGNRRTRPASPRAAVSIRGVPWWPRARRRSWGSRRRARARTWGSSPIRTVPSRPATRRR